MSKRAGEVEAPVWLGGEAELSRAFGGGKLWIGRHETDHDILIFDPSEADPEASVLALYSLTQHRVRRFPRSVALERIQPLSEKAARSRAKSAYAERETLRAQHEEAQAEAALERRSRQRDGARAAHRRYVESVGLTYEGVREAEGETRRGRRINCQACGIALDGFADALCAICNGVLCSCGACGCGRS